MKLSDVLLSYNQIKIPEREVIPITIPKSYYEIPIETVQEFVETPEETPVETPKRPSVYDYWESLTSRIQSRQSESQSESQSARWTSSYSDRNKWIKDLTIAYKKQGLNDNAIKNLIAKNALESNWGKSAQGDYNFGNLTTGKVWKGRFVQGKDKDKNGKTIVQNFRAYDSLDDFVKDEIQFLTRLYDFNQNDDLSTFLNKLQGGNTAGRYYAEDPSYKNKIKQRYLNI